MPRNRNPNGKADVSGASLKNPGRYRGRRGPWQLRPIGEPYQRMTDAQKAIWRECRVNMPWLHSSDRILLRLVCILAARMDEGGTVGIQATMTLGSLLSKLGATPVDASRVLHTDDDEADDPADEFFTRH